MSDRQDKVAEELRSLRGDNAGVLDPERIVDFASDPETALHAKFEWDDSVAGHKHRIWQARQLIRVYVTVLDTGKGAEPIRMYVTTVQSEEQPGGYRLTEEVLGDEEARHSLIIGQLNRLLSIIKSYPLPELKPIEAAIDRCMKQAMKGRS
jgi:hypothetical protein